MSSAIVIRPTEIDDDVLISSTVTEDDYSEWSAATTYALDDIVQVAASHRVYKSLAADNLNNAVTDTTKWLDLGPTRRWAMFDDSVGTYTTDASPITVVLRPGVIGALALFDVTARTVRLQMVDWPTGQIVYDVTQNVADQTISEWYEYLTAPFGLSGDMMFSDLPTSSDNELTITIEGDGTLAVGVVTMGSVATLGSPTYGMSVRLINRGKVTTSDAGLSYLQARRSSRTVNAVLQIEAKRLNALVALLESLDNTVCCWWLYPATGYEGLMVYGYHRDTRIALPNAFRHDVTLQLETLA